MWCSTSTLLLLLWLPALSVWAEPSIVGVLPLNPSTASVRAPVLDVNDEASRAEDGMGYEEIRDEGLRDWAVRQRPTHGHHWVSTCDDCFLVVGVKTRAVRGFQARQLIRASWAHVSITHPLVTRVVFLGCEPDWSQEEDENTTRQALELEKAEFGDLLTSELGGCVDSYARLIDKVVGYYRWVSLHHPTTPYVMTTDDDVYTRLDRVVAMLQNEATPRTRYYAGQVSFLQLGRFMPAIRDPRHRNYLSVDDYPMAEHSPRAIGAHYLLSSDLVRFIVKNHHYLRSVGTIEDLTIGVWLRFLLQVHAVHLRSFDTITTSICRNSCASFGNLSPHGMRQIQENVKRGDAFCHAFEYRSWVEAKSSDPIRAKTRPRNDVRYEWEFHVEPTTRAFTILIMVELLGAPRLPPLAFTPSLGTFIHFCVQLTKLVANKSMPLLQILCDDAGDRLGEFLEIHPPTNSALLALARSNLPHLATVVMYVTVWISKQVLRWRAFIECLMAEIYADLHVFVIDEIWKPNATENLTPDFAVIGANELEIVTSLVPPTCIFLVFTTDVIGLKSSPATHSSETAAYLASSVLVLNQDSQQRPTTQPRRLYVPLASLVFSDSAAHNPLALLRSSAKRLTMLTRPENFAVPDCNARAIAMLRLLTNETDACRCEIPYSDDINERADPVDRLFVFDAEIKNYTRAKFVLAFETAQVVYPGHIADTIVAAFLAGSVPIYDGDDLTVSHLFNPKAFVSCQRFASLEYCAEYVNQVLESPALYGAMWNEPPVVNETAFYEVFSWHPDVLRRLRERRDKVFEERVSMVAQMNELITSV